MLNYSKMSGSIRFRVIKRLFDIVFSLILVPPVSIIIIISSIFIKLEDGGSIFYIAERVGLFGKIFRMYKLRTMKENSPDIRLKDGSTYNSLNDPRVTKFGRLARKTSIDELPQVFNVLKGDMSYVGPRPDTPTDLNGYTDKEKIILTVRPGITGYNQAKNRNSVSAKIKLKNDIYYVNHLSVLFDLQIILKTVLAVIQKKNINRKKIKQNKLYILGEDGVMKSIV